MTMRPARTRTAFFVTAWIALALPTSMSAPLVQEEAEASEKPAEAGSETPEAKPESKPDRVAAAHIIISFVDAPNALPGVTRSKEEAKARATEAAEKARADDADFDKVVLEYTDDPRGKLNGGKIGVLMPGRLLPQFSALEAVFDVEVGEITEPVETAMGFHVLKRLAIVEYAASHILIRYAGSDNAPPDVTRTKEEAKALAETVLEKAKAEGADFAALAMEHSEGPTAPRGGSLGIFLSGQMVQPFEKAVSLIKVGEVTGPVETGFGFHIIRRDAIERIRASHILIQYTGAAQAPPTITRSKEDAQKFAEKLQADASAEGADFAALAMEHSEGPSGPRGGDLGLFERGSMVPAFSDVAFALEVGEVSKVVETPFGFHVILRTE